MRRLLEVFALTVFAAACGPSPAYDVEEPATPVRRTHRRRIQPSRAPSHALVGRWEGTGTQNNGLSWPIVVSITSVNGGTCAQVSYPEQRCGGEWRCQAANGASMHATEALTYGHEICVDQGDMDMTLTDDGLLEWNWSGRGLSASATLSRSDR